MYDLIGVGFGPSNLALAIAVDEYNRTARTPVSALFLERQPRFGWHRGMLIDDAMMQVSFLKDLVTLRNPTSEFSFLAYLHSKGRLSDFINHKSLFPLRVEFHDYLEWAADRFDDVVRYDHEVTRISLGGRRRVRRRRRRDTVPGAEPGAGYGDGPQPAGRRPAPRPGLAQPGPPRPDRMAHRPRRLAVVGAGRAPPR